MTRTAIPPAHLAVTLTAWGVPLLAMALREAGVAALIVAAVAAALTHALPARSAPDGPWQRAVDAWLPLLAGAAVAGLVTRAGGPPAVGLAALAWLLSPSVPVDRRVGPALGVAAAIALLLDPTDGPLHLGWTLLDARWSAGAGAIAVLLGALGAASDESEGAAGRRLGVMAAVAVLLALAWERAPERADLVPIGAPAALLLACAGVVAAQAHAQPGDRLRTRDALVGATLTGWFAATPTALPALTTLLPLAAALSRLGAGLDLRAAVVALAAVAAWPGLPSALPDAAAVAATAGGLVWAIGLTALGRARPVPA